MNYTEIFSLLGISIVLARLSIFIVDRMGYMSKEDKDLMPFLSCVPLVNLLIILMVPFVLIMHPFYYFRNLNKLFKRVEILEEENKRRAKHGRKTPRNNTKNS